MTRLPPGPHARRRLGPAVQLLLRHDRRPAGRDHRAQPAAHPARRARPAPAPTRAGARRRPLRAGPGLQRRRLVLRRAAQAGQPAVRAGARRRHRAPRARRCSGSRCRPRGGPWTSARLRPSNDPAFERAVRNFVWSVTWHPASRTAQPVEAWTQMLFPPAPQRAERSDGSIPPPSSRPAPPSWAT